MSGIFSRPQALRSAAGNTTVYGWIVRDGARVDEVLAAVYRAPKSFTGEDMVEISCHGGLAVVSAVHRLLLKSGFRQAERGEFTFRAYINGKTDLTRAEAVREIIDGRTDESCLRAAGRLAGNLLEEISGIRRLLTDTLAAIEAEIEYPEDEETIADSFDRSALEDAERLLLRLSDSWRSEKLYQDGSRAVLCGRTNAGKSSLFNTILKEERAIVSEIAGTTRDWLEAWADMDGVPVRIFDTAGLRDTDDVIEARGVALTRSLTEDAELVLYLTDGARGVSDEDMEFLSACGRPVIFIWNKSDLCAVPPALTAAQKSRIPALRGEIVLSAKNGDGLLSLCAAVKETLVQDLPAERPQAGLGSLRQKTAVEDALGSVRHALSAADGCFTLDAVVQDLEDALNSLGEVTGEVTPDDVLDSIFSNFCVGK